MIGQIGCTLYKWMTHADLEQLGRQLNRLIDMLYHFTGMSLDKTRHQNACSLIVHCMAVDWENMFTAVNIGKSSH